MALELTRKDYDEGLEAVNDVLSSGDFYLDRFKMNFPDGINTASALEICRVLQESTDPEKLLDAKIRLAKICIAGKNCEMTLPDGATEKFCLSNINDSFDAFPVFEKYPLALIALTDAIYGYVLKKSMRP